MSSHYCYYHLCVITTPVASAAVCTLYFYLYIQRLKLIHTLIKNSSPIIIGSYCLLTAIPLLPPIIFKGMALDRKFHVCEFAREINCGHNAALLIIIVSVRRGEEEKLEWHAVV